METKLWLVRAAAVAAMGSMITAAMPAAAQAAPPKKAAEDDGPFAPKGKTGKLREAEEAENAPKPTPEAPPPKEKPYSAGVDIVYGFGKSGSGTETGPTPIEYKVASILLGFTYQAAPNINARIRLPVSNGSISKSLTEAPSDYSATALGNLELAMTYQLSDMGPHTKLPFDIALGLPIGQGDRFPPAEGQGRRQTFHVNTAAQWSRGLEEDALFAPHRLSLVPSLGLRYRGGGINTGGYLKTPLLLRMGGEDAPTLTTDGKLYKINSLVFEAVAGGDFHIDVSQNKIDVGARAWIAWMSAEYVAPQLEGTTGAPRFQFAVEPQIRGTFGPVKAVLGVILPFGGRLYNELQSTTGIRIGASYGF